jgi:hypothetical protein
VAVTIAKNADAWQISLPDTDVRHSARYEVRGLERFWTFGSADGRSPAFAFSISPSGGGVYYSRGNGNEWIPLDAYYYCRDRQAAEQRERVTREGNAQPAEAGAQSERDRVAAEQRRRAAELQAALAAESERAESEAAGLLDEYIRTIETRIKQNWNRPLSARPGIDCVVNVVQLPSGDVMSATVAACNGDDAVRRSIERAVLDASPLPMPPDPSLFERNLRVNFRPDE